MGCHFNLQVNSLPLSYLGSPRNLALFCVWEGFPGGSEGKVSACNAGDSGSIPGLGRSPGEGNGNPLQYSCLENPVDGGAWEATVHGLQRVGRDWATSLVYEKMQVSGLWNHFFDLHLATWDQDPLFSQFPLRDGCRAWLLYGFSSEQPVCPEFPQDLQSVCDGLIFAASFVY